MSTQDKLAEALNSLRLKFTSGNDVPVPEARITRAEWEAIEQAHAAAAAQIKGEPFTGFRDGRRGDLVVDREALHASPGYKRQIAALDELRSAQAQAQSGGAERLAEALRSLGERLSSVLCDPFGDVVVRGSDGDRQVIAKALKDLGELAAHSAQAQPQSGEWVMVPTEPTKAMVEAVCKIKLDRLEALRSGREASSGIVSAVREEWEAMLATAPQQTPQSMPQWRRSPAMADTMTLEQVLIEVRIVADNGCMTITRENCAEWADAIDAAIRERDELRSLWARDKTAAVRYLDRAEKAEAELAEMRQTFDLRWKADMRAIEQWRAAHPGNELVMPDHADLCMWLMTELAALKARIADALIADVRRAPSGLGRVEVEGLPHDWIDKRVRLVEE